MTYPSLKLTRAEVVARARRWVGREVTYVLGAGGRDPSAADPQTTRQVGHELRRGSDCSGFVCWALGLDRFQPIGRFPFRGGWVSTDSICESGQVGMHARQLFTRTTWPRIGDLLVWPGADVDHDGDRDRIGHVAIITAIDQAFDVGAPDYTLLTVVHCHGPAGNPHAVSETDGGLWQRHQQRRLVIKGGETHGPRDGWESRVGRYLELAD